MAGILLNSGNARQPILYSTEIFIDGGGLQSRYRMAAGLQMQANSLSAD